MILKAGSYRSVIPPPLGICMEDGFDLVRAENVLDDIFANALVIDAGQTEVALVSVDVGCIEIGVYHQITSLAAQMTGIREENILVTATHTHTGPATGMTLE